MTDNIQITTARTIYPLEPGKQEARTGILSAREHHPPVPQPISWIGVVLLAPVFGLMAFGLVWAIGMLAVI
jgi:hypothetical protein